MVSDRSIDNNAVFDHSDALGRFATDSDVRDAGSSRAGIPVRVIDRCAEAPVLVKVDGELASAGAESLDGKGSDR